jgi:acyl-CoA reductase-like NAD-dependent aldehyde dehydrogenase
MDSDRQAVASVSESAALADIERVFELQRAAHLLHPYPDARARQERLDRLLAMLKAHRAEIETVISADFGNRSKVETLALEILSSVEEIRHTKKRLPKWMKRERRPGSLNTWPGRAEIVRQPLGVVGVVVPWNYPLFLAISPLVGALAAGNRVMLKMSEYTPQFSAFFADIVAQTFADDEVFVVTGSADVARAFVSKPFDHLLFTGSTGIGRQVMQAAAANLTPVTLELGGKSPTIVAADIPLERAVPQIMFGKLVNAGQTCIAPDYVLVPRGREQAFVEFARKSVMHNYPTLENNPDYTCVVNEKQAQRLRRYIDDARQQGATIIPLHDEVAPAGSRKFTPLAITGTTDGMLVMQEEIFGPLLPVVGYDSIDQAIDFVNRRPRPLALYVFSDDAAVVDKVLGNTTSGGVAVNDVMMHVIQNDLPFGGVGPSGIGHYHGKEGFDTFSKVKGVFRQARFNSGALLRPPYGNGRLRKLTNFLLR